LTQLHRKFTDEQIKELIEKYLRKEVGRRYLQKIPYFRLQKALKEGTSLFREFKVRTPYQSVKDIFCLRLDRTVDSYRGVSIKNLVLKINGATSGDKAISVSIL
jgi:hypothetical protein